MVAIFLPPMWLSLVPVVLLEAWILRRMLSLPIGTALRSSTIGNVLTTIIGVPLVWLALAFLEGTCCGGAAGLTTFGQKVYAVTIQSPWLIPYEKDLSWMIPAAMAVLVIPFFIVTVAIEGFVNRRVLANADPKRVWKATWVANAWSYLLIVMLAWPAFLIAGKMGRWVIIDWFIGAVFASWKLIHG